MNIQTSKLSAAQRAILTTACERKSGLVLPLTVPLKGGALNKVLESLIAKGLVDEAPAFGKQEVWRTRADGTPLILKAAPAAYKALGLARPKRAARRAGKPDKAVGKPPRRTQADTKQAQVIAMLKQPQGATIGEIVAATDWLAHTVRGFLSGALKKRLGLEVTSEVDEDRGRVYRIG
jgi:hypothetical protein